MIYLAFETRPADYKRYNGPSAATVQGKPPLNVRLSNRARHAAAVRLQFILAIPVRFRARWNLLTYDLCTSIVIRAMADADTSTFARAPVRSRVAVTVSAPTRRVVWRWGMVGPWGAWGAWGFRMVRDNGCRPVVVFVGADFTKCDL